MDETTKQINSLERYEALIRQKMFDKGWVFYRCANQYQDLDKVITRGPTDKLKEKESYQLLPAVREGIRIPAIVIRALDIYAELNEARYPIIHLPEDMSEIALMMVTTREDRLKVLASSMNDFPNGRRRGGQFRTDFTCSEFLDIIKSMEAREF